MATATATVQPPIVLHLQIEQIVEDENIRKETEYEISDDFKAKLTIGGMFQNIQSIICYNEPDSSGEPCYVLTDGYRRLKAAMEMEASGIPVPFLKVEVWQREQALEIANDPMKRIEYQFKLGTSGKQISAMDAANSQKEWIDLHYQTVGYPNALAKKIKELVKTGMSEDEAQSLAPSKLVESKIYKASKVACSAELGIPNDTIDKNLRIALLPETAPYLLELVESGDIKNIYDAEDIRAFWNKNVLTKHEDSTIESFADLCKIERDKRNPNGVIRKEDAQTVLKNLNQQAAQSATDARIAQIENEKLREAIESGNVTNEVAASLLDHSEKTGTSIDSLLESATAIAESDPDEYNSPVIMTDDDVKVALADSKREIAAQTKQETSIADLTNEDLKLEIQRSLTSLFLMVCGDDLESSFEAVRNGLANYQANKGAFLAEGDRDFMTEIYGIMNTSSTKIEKAEAKLDKRISAEAAKAAKALEQAEAKVAMDEAAKASRAALAADNV